MARKEKCKFCRREHRPETNCKDVPGCWCQHGQTHVRHPLSPRYAVCTVGMNGPVDRLCPCVYLLPGPVPARAV